MAMMVSILPRSKDIIIVIVNKTKRKPRKKRSKKPRRRLQLRRQLLLRRLLLLRRMMPRSQQPQPSLQLRMPKQKPRRQKQLHQPRRPQTRNTLLLSMPPRKMKRKKSRRK